MARIHKNAIAFAVLLATLSTASSAFAKTTSKTISVSATITNGSTVSVFIVGDGARASVANDTDAPRLAKGVAPLVRVGFEMKDSSYFVKRVSWDKAHHQLTIDF
jgi:hypothetical protein